MHVYASIILITAHTFTFSYINVFCYYNSSYICLLTCSYMNVYASFSKSRKRNEHIFSLLLPHVYYTF